MNLYKTLPEVIEKHEYISFDIFDTLIQRSCGYPGNIFRIIEQKYNREYRSGISDFYNIRVLSESIARKITSKYEVTLDDIYKEVSKRYSQKTAETLKDIELATEYEECIGRQELCDIYNKVVKEKTVIITSDMYLSSDFLKAILEKNGLEMPHRIFVSSEANATKRDGNLFLLALNDIECKPSEMLHIGDNLRGDYLSPKLLGMHSYIVNRK